MVAPPASSADPVLQHRDALPVGTRLAEFELQGLLGVGGFGLVYRAYDHSLHRLVAIKEYMPTALAGRAGMTVSARSSVDQLPFRAGLSSFMAEARLLAQFDHPSLAKVFRVWAQNDTAYIAMPLYQGMTLKQAYAQMRIPPSEAWLRSLMWPLLEALKVLHRHQMVHRDLAPDNIFLQDIGPPVLLDLGAARRAIGEHTQRHTAIVKVNYAPIEQYADAEDLRQGPWSDLYALAAVVHGCLRREPPMPATFRVLRDRLPPLAAVTASLQAQFGQVYSSAFVGALTQALAIQPVDRPQSVAAFAELLQLTPPPAPERFDWRAALGAAWQPPPQAVVAPAAARDEQAHLPTLASGPQGAAGARRGRGPAFWGMAGAVVFGVLAVVLVLVARPLPAPAAAQVGALPVPPAGASAPAGAADRTDGRRDGAKASPRLPSRTLSAQDLCPDSNFLTRPMCLHSACQKARFASLPVCVENSRRLRDNRERGGA